MALETAQDYHFADVSGIDISGETLADHPKQWRVNRGEDFAFLYEAYCERMTIYREAMYWMSQNDAEEYVKKHYTLFAGGPEHPRWRIPLRSYVYALVEHLENHVFNPSHMAWCSGVPEDRDYAENPGSELYGLAPEIFPSLNVSEAFVSHNVPNVWTGTFLKAEYWQLAARQHFLCEAKRWLDEDKVKNKTKVQRYSPDTKEMETVERENQGWYAYFSLEEGLYEGKYLKSRWEQAVPLPIPYDALKLPPELDADKGKMITYWICQGRNEEKKPWEFSSWHLKVTDYYEDMEGYMKELGSKLAQYKFVNISSSIVGFIAPASNMRTYIANEQEEQG